jgi:hypothetical protein
MGIGCLFGHKWNGCKCEKCGKTRDENHNWDLCKGECSVCGKSCEVQHTWNGCKCEKCGKVRDENHSWDLCKSKCKFCGKTKSNFSVYRVVTVNHCPTINGRSSIDLYKAVMAVYEEKFNDFVKSLDSYRELKALWTEADKHYEWLINPNIVSAPIEWLASETGDSYETISALSEIRLFMVQNEAHSGFEKFSYSICDYFLRIKTEETHDDISNKGDAFCPYYKDNKCIAGNQINDCSSNPHNYCNCFVYKYNNTGDVSVLY